MATPSGGDSFSEQPDRTAETQVPPDRKSIRKEKMKQMRDDLAKLRDNLIELLSNEHSEWVSFRKSWVEEGDQHVKAELHRFHDNAIAFQKAAFKAIAKASSLKVLGDRSGFCELPLDTIDIFVPTGGAAADKPAVLWKLHARINDAISRENDVRAFMEELARLDGALDEMYDAREKVKDGGTARESVTRLCESRSNFKEGSWLGLNAAADAQCTELEIFFNDLDALVAEPSYQDAQEPEWLGASEAPRCLRQALRRFSACSKTTCQKLKTTCQKLKTTCQKLKDRTQRDEGFTSSLSKNDALSKNGALTQLLASWQTLHAKMAETEMKRTQLINALQNLQERGITQLINKTKQNTNRQNNALQNLQERGIELLTPASVASVVDEFFSALTGFDKAVQSQYVSLDEQLHKAMLSLYANVPTAKSTAPAAAAHATAGGCEADQLLDIDTRKARPTPLTELTFGKARPTPLTEMELRWSFVGTKLKWRRRDEVDMLMPANSEEGSLSDLLDSTLVAMRTLSHVSRKHLLDLLSAVGNSLKVVRKGLEDTGEGLLTKDLHSWLCAKLGEPTGTQKTDSDEMDKKVCAMLLVNPIVDGTAQLVEMMSTCVRLGDRIALIEPEIMALCDSGPKRVELLRQFGNVCAASRGLQDKLMEAIRNVPKRTCDAVVCACELHATMAPKQRLSSDASVQAQMAKVIEGVANVDQRLLSMFERTEQEVKQARAAVSDLARMDLFLALRVDEDLAGTTSEKASDKLYRVQHIMKSASDACRDQILTHLASLESVGDKASGLLTGLLLERKEDVIKHVKSMIGYVKKLPTIDKFLPCEVCEMLDSVFDAIVKGFMQMLRFAKDLACRVADFAEDNAIGKDAANGVEVLPKELVTLIEEQQQEDQLKIVKREVLLQLKRWQTTQLAELRRIGCKIRAAGCACLHKLCDGIQQLVQGTVSDGAQAVLEKLWKAFVEASPTTLFQLLGQLDTRLLAPFKAVDDAAADAKSVVEEVDSIQLDVKLDDLPPLRLSASTAGSNMACKLDDHLKQMTVKLNGSMAPLKKDCQSALLDALSLVEQCNAEAKALVGKLLCKFRHEIKEQVSNLIAEVDEPLIAQALSTAHSIVKAIFTIVNSEAPSSEQAEAALRGAIDSSELSALEAALAVASCEVREGEVGAQALSLRKGLVEQAAKEKAKSSEATVLVDKFGQVSHFTLDTRKQIKKEQLAVSRALSEVVLEVREALEQVVKFKDDLLEAVRSPMKLLKLVLKLQSRLISIHSQIGEHIETAKEELAAMDFSSLQAEVSVLSPLRKEGLEALEAMIAFNDAINDAIMDKIIDSLTLLPNIAAPDAGASEKGDSDSELPIKQLGKVVQLVLNSLITLMNMRIESDPKKADVVADAEKLLGETTEARALKALKYDCVQYRNTMSGAVVGVLKAFVSVREDAYNLRKSISGALNTRQGWWAAANGLAKSIADALAKQPQLEQIMLGAFEKVDSALNDAYDKVVHKTEIFDDRLKRYLDEKGSTLQGVSDGSGQLEINKAAVRCTKLRKRLPQLKQELLDVLERLHNIKDDVVKLMREEYKDMMDDARTAITRCFEGLTGQLQLDSIEDMLEENGPEPGEETLSSVFESARKLLVGPLPVPRATVPDSLDAALKEHAELGYQLAQLESTITKKINPCSFAHTKVTQELDKVRMKARKVRDTARKVRDTISKQLAQSLLQMFVSELSKSASELRTKVADSWPLRSPKKSRVRGIHEAFNSLETMLSRSHARNARTLDTCRQAITKALDEELRPGLRDLFESIDENLLLQCEMLGDELQLKKLEMKIEQLRDMCVVLTVEGEKVNDAWTQKALNLVRNVRAMITDAIEKLGPLEVLDLLPKVRKSMKNFRVLFLILIIFYAFYYAIIAAAYAIVQAATQKPLPFTPDAPFLHSEEEFYLSIDRPPAFARWASMVLVFVLVMPINLYVFVQAEWRLTKHGEWLLHQRRNASKYYNDHLKMGAKKNSAKVAPIRSRPTVEPQSESTCSQKGENSMPPRQRDSFADVASLTHTMLAFGAKVAPVGEGKVLKKQVCFGSGENSMPPRQRDSFADVASRAHTMLTRGASFDDKVRPVGPADAVVLKLKRGLMHARDIEPTCFIRCGRGKYEMGLFLAVLAIKQPRYDPNELAKAVHVLHFFLCTCVTGTLPANSLFWTTIVGSFLVSGRLAQCMLTFRGKRLKKKAKRRWAKVALSRSSISRREHLYAGVAPNTSSGSGESDATSAEE